MGNRIRSLGLDLQRDLLDLFTASAGDFLDGWFESAPIKAAFGFDSIVGNYASPYAPGSAYVLLHHNFGEVNGKKGVWGHAIGGMGAITQAMAKAAITPWRGHQAFDAGAPGHCREWPRRRRRDGQGRDNPCRGRCRRDQSQAPLPRTSSIRLPCPRDFGGAWKTGVAARAHFA